MSETIESNQRHRAASGINIERCGSASQNQRQRDGKDGKDGRDGRDEGFFRVSLRISLGFL